MRINCKVRSFAWKLRNNLLPVKSDKLSIFHLKWRYSFCWKIESKTKPNTYFFRESEFLPNCRNCFIDHEQNHVFKFFSFPQSKSIVCSNLSRQLGDHREYFASLFSCVYLGWFSYFRKLT